MSKTRAKQSPTQLVYALGSIVGLIVLLFWMEGGFTTKTPPGTAIVSEAKAPPRGETATAVMKEIDEIMAWPGTVSARTVAQIAPKVAARVVEITVKAGDAVKAGQVLAKLDERELQSRLGQARSLLTAAQAQADRAAADARRTQNLFDQEAATRQSLEAALAATRTANARVAEARSAIGEAESLFGETTLRAPFDGVVVKRQLEPGDMALPGSPILVLQSARRLRIEAAIPERCAGVIQKGGILQGRIAERQYAATVEEIAPAADPQTRTVLVKAGLHDQVAAQPGAFAWIEQVCGRHQALLIPADAVGRTGQLESVRLVVDGRTLLRHVRTAKLHDGWIEVLAGLKEGDVVSAVAP